jgi:sporulation protein YhbH
MVLKIEKDHQRFRQIVKGRIRDDLRKFLTRGELIGKEGKHLISIPIRGVDLPEFRYGDNSQGVGSGDGKEGDQVGQGQPGKGKGAGGEQPGQHLMEVDLSLDELAEILGEELKLPRIEPKGKHRITIVREKYSSLRKVGPESLRHFKRSFKEALKRQIMVGDYDPENPVIIPEKKDIRYRSWKEVKAPQSNALIVFMMDVSGSMGEEQKELVRLESFWIDTWLRKNYEGIESRYIVHDVSAKEVDKHTFYHLREDGGTKISSAYKTAKQLLESHYSPDEWNIYLFHFSDGDNSSEADSRDCVKILKEQLLPICNMFGYCQVASAYGSGNFINVLHEHLRNHEKVLTSRVNSKDDIYDSIKTFFGKGH